MKLSSKMIDLFGTQRQVFLRSGSAGDSGAYNQVITDEDYKVDFWTQGVSLINTTNILYQKRQLL